MGDVVRARDQQRVRVGDRNAQTHFRHHRPVDQIVPDVGNVLRGDGQFAQQIVEGQHFI